MVPPLTLVHPTPVVQVPELGWLKLELCHPTGTHKDRESLRIVEHCATAGIRDLGCGSTGNFAISLSYFAMLKGLTCHVWIPRAAENPGLLGFLTTFGARIHWVDAMTGLYATSSEEMKQLGIYDANPGRCPLKALANAEVSLELVEQIPGLSSVVCPVNNGSILLGVIRGLAGRGIKVYGVYSHSRFASSISGFHAAEDRAVIETEVARTGGRLIEVTDRELAPATRALAAVGINAEVSSASVIGALDKVDGTGRCAIITGSGLKKPEEAGALLASERSG